MKRFLLFFVILAFSFIIPSCSAAVKVPVDASEEKPTSSWDKAWVGKTYTQISDKLGQPEMTISDGKDGQILVYDCISVNKPSGNDSAKFFLNSKGVCTRVEPGVALSARARSELKGIPYDEDDDYHYSEEPTANHIWSFILDNALTTVLLISFLIWFN